MALDIVQKNNHNPHERQSTINLLIDYFTLSQRANAQNDQAIDCLGSAHEVER
jgi:hypothetical protein